MNDREIFASMLGGPKESMLKKTIKRSMTTSQLDLLTRILMYEYPKLNFLPLEYTDESCNDIVIKVIGTNPYSAQGIIAKFEYYKTLKA